MKNGNKKNKSYIKVYIYMEIAKIDLEIKKLLKLIKNNEKSFIESYKEIAVDTNKYMKELKEQYKEEINKIKKSLDEKIKGLMDILKHLEKISAEELKKSEGNEVKYDLGIVLNELESLKKERDLLKNII